MSLVTGTAANDTKTFNAGDDYSLSGGTDTLVFNQTDADLTSTTLTSVEVLKAGQSTATTFTVDPADLASGGSVIGSSGFDSLIINDTAFDLTSTSLTSIEILQAGSASDTTFTLDQGDLASNGTVIGSTGTDTLAIKGTSLNLTSTTLTSIEKIAAGSSLATTFTVDATDLASGGTVQGSTGIDTLILKGAAPDLTSTTLTSIEKLQAGQATATNFIVDAADLASGGSVVGSSGSDTLTVLDTAIDLTSTTLTSVEKLAAGLTDATTFTLNQADLASGGSVIGSGQDDTLIIKGTSVDLTSTSLTSVEILQSDTTSATTFTVDQADLISGGTVIGGVSNDTLAGKGSALDLSSTTLTSIEILKAATTTPITITVDQNDLASGGSVVGNSGSDTLAAAGTELDLTSTTLTSIEKLQASGAGTLFTVDAADLASGGSVIGSVGTDTLVILGTSFNLSSTTATGVEILQGGSASNTTFTVDQADLASGGSIVGSSGTDTLTTKGVSLNLASTDLTSIEILKAGSASATTFTVDQNDLSSLGTIQGSTGVDTLASADAALDLTSTTLTSIEKLQSKAGGTAWIVDAADLASGGSVVGSTTGLDSLTVIDTAINLTSTTLTSVETIAAGSASDTTFTVDQADLATNGSVIGSTGADTLAIKGTSLNLTSTTLTSIEKIAAGTSLATTFTVDQADLANGGNVIGSSGIDTLVLKGAAPDLTSTTLTSIEKLQAGQSTLTNFIVDAADLVSGGSVIGSSGSDTLTVLDTAIDLTSTTLTSVEKLAAGSSLATTFTVDQADLSAGGTVAGSTGSDTLIIKGTSFDVSSTTLLSVEKLQASSSLATTFTVDQGDLASGGEVIGSSGNDTLVAKGVALDLTSTTLTSVETLKAGSASATTFTVDQADLLAGGSVTGNSGVDNLVAGGVALDLTSTALTSVEVLKAGSSLATTFTVDQADLAAGGSVVGNAGVDTLVIKGTSLNLGSTGINSIEILKAGSSLDTTFTVDQADLVSGGSVVGSSGVDTLIAKGTALNLTSTGLTSIEKLQASVAATTFTVDQADLANGGSVIGSTGVDTLAAGGTELDLTSTTLSSIEVLKGSASGTKITVDAADLLAGGSVTGTGTTATDTLVINGTTFDLTSTSLTGIEILKAGSASATTFTVDQADLASGGSIVGSSGSDTLIAKGTALNLASTTLTSIETLQAGSSLATTFTLDGDDLSKLTLVQGSSGIDTLAAGSANIDLTSTTLGSIEILKTGVSLATTFTVDQADLAAGGTVIGSSGQDTLAAGDTALDLTSTTLSSIEILKAGTSFGTTFTVDPTDLVAGGSVVGSTGNDTLIIKGTLFDVSSSALSSIEILKASSSLATNFTVDQADIAAGGSILGSSGTDTLIAKGTALDLSSTVLSSIEILKAGNATATTFTVDQADLASGGSVVGSTGADILAASGTQLDLTSTALTSIENLKASSFGTLFTVDAADLATGGSVTGGAGTDTLIILGTSFNLSSTAATGIEILKGGSSLDTTFTLDQADLASGGQIVGSSGVDTLLAKGTSLDLSSTALTSIEKLQAGTSAATTFVVDSNDLAAGGSIIGSSGVDTLKAGSAALDLTSTTLTSIEKLQAATIGTTFTVDAADLAAGGSVAGDVGLDTLIIKGTTFDVSNSFLSGIDVLQAGSSLATTFTVDAADLASGGSVVGSSGIDTLIIKGTAYNLSSTALTSIEVLQAGSSLATTFTLDANDLVNGGSVVGGTGLDVLIAGTVALDLSHTLLSSIDILKAGTSLGTTFTVDQADLANGGSVIGSSGVDTLAAAGTGLDLTATTLTSIEVLKAANSLGTTFVVDVADLASGGSVIGSSGNDTLVVQGTAVNLGSTSLTSVEILKGSSSNDTVFTVDQADLASGGSVIGSSGNDTLVAAGTALDLSSTSLTSIETLKAGLSLATTFTVNQADLASGGSVVGSSGIDILTTADSVLDLTSTTLSSIEVLAAGTTNATTFIVDTADLASGGTVIGNAGNDTLSAGTTSIDLTSTTLSSVEIMKTGSASATTFTVDQADLISGGTVAGSSGSDSLVIKGTSLDLSSTALTSIERLAAGSSNSTTFTVDAADLAAGGSVVGSNGNDTLIVKNTAFDLTSTSLTSVEILQAGSAAATTFTVDAADLASGGSVLGSSGSDTLVIKGTAFDLTSTSLSSVEILEAGSSLATTFTVDVADLASGGSVVGSSGVDTLIGKATAIDLSSTTLTSIESLKAGSSLATTFTVDAADLASGGSVTGSSSVDTLIIKGTAADLTSTALSSIEVLQAGSSLATTFTVNPNDLALGGSVIGSSGIDTLTIVSTAFDLSSTTLTLVEILKAGVSNATTFTLDQADLTSGGSVIGSSGNDTLVVQGTAVNLGSTSLTSIEILKTSSSNDTSFTVDQADLASGGSVIGNSGNDTLVAAGTALDLSSTSLTSIETLKAGSSLATTFTVNQADLASGGSVIGSAGVDTLTTADSAIDLTSTALSSIEVLAAGTTNATTFTLDTADLASGGSVVGNAGNDTLSAGTTSIDLTSTTLTSVEILKAGSSLGTTFTIDQADLASGGSIVGSSGTDTLAINGTSLNLASTTLSSVEVLQAGTSLATTFTVDQADLASGGSVVGSSGIDTLAASGTTLDLGSTSLTSVEILKAGSASATTFTVDAGDLAAGGSVIGSSGNDTVVVNGTAFDLTSTTLTSVEILKAGSSLSTTFTVDAADLASGGSVVGGAGTDTLIGKTTAIDLSSTTLTSIENLKAGTSLGTTFTVDAADLASSGSVTGSSGVDTLIINGTNADLTSTTLTSIEVLQTGSSLATTFTVNPTDLASGGSVVGSSGNDTLVVASTAFDLSSTTLGSVEILKAGLSTATTFTLDQADLSSGGSVIGSSGSDTLAAKGTALDLTSTTLSSIEQLKAGSSLATTLTVDQADLASGGSVIGSTGNDTLVAAGAALDLTSTTLTSVEILQAGLSVATTFTVDAADLASGGSVIGSSGSDTLLVKSTGIDLSSTTLSSIEILKTGSSLATTFTVDQADLIAGGSVVGSSGSDSLAAAGTSLDLSSTALTSIEILKAGNSNATTFVVDQADLSSGGSVQGSSGNDTLTVNGTSLDFSSTSLTSIEILKAGSSLATTFTIDQADLANTGTVLGNAGNDTLAAFGTGLDLTSTTLSSVEILKAGSSLATTFTVDQADLASGGTVIGSTGSDSLTAGGTALDLSSTTLTSIEQLKAGLSIATTFTVDQSDLSNGGSVIGSTGNDTLAIKGTSLDLTSTTLTSVEVLKAGSNLATTFTVDAADLASGGSVTGSTGIDTLIVNNVAYNLTSTTLTSVEVLQAGSSLATTFTVDQADLIGGGTVAGSTGSDILLAFGTVLDLSNTTLTSIETLKAGNVAATTFTVDQADLASNGSVTGSTGSDILVANGTQLDLSSTTLTSIETLKAGLSLATTFTVDQADLASAGSVTGSSGNDTLSIFSGTSLDLTSTTLTSVEILKSGSTSAMTFTVDAADLLSGGSVVGTAGVNDTLLVKGTAADLSSTTLTSVEVLKAQSSLATTFTLDQADLISGGSVTGSSGSDTITAFGTNLDLSSTVLTSIEVLKAGNSNATTFTVDQSDLASAGSVTGSTGNDTLAAAGTALDLTSTTLTSIELLKANSTSATTFTVDAADLASGGTVIGNTGNDILLMKVTTFNLASTTLSSVEILTAGTAGATTFTVDQADLASGGTVNGSTGSDILLANGTTLDLSSTTLTSIETLKAGSSLATTFTIDQADLVASSSVTGSTGNDTLVAAGTALDLSSTTLTSIEILKTGNGLATTFTVDAADLASGGSVTGGAGNDTLIMKTTAFDLTSTTLSSIEILQAGPSTATTFTVDQADLATGGSVLGSSGSDILLVKGTAFDLTSTTLSSIENLKAQSSLATTFTVDQADLVASGSVTGSSGNDTLAINGTSLDLSSTTLSSVEILKANLSTATTFVVDQADLISTGTVTGSTGNDTLTIFSGTSLDLTSTTLTSVEILKSGSTSAMTFTVDAADLLSGGSVVGTAGNADTLLIKGTAFDLTSTSLTSIEVLKAQSSLATTFTIDQADLASGGSVTGSSGSDTLIINGASLDLSSTTTTSVEILKAGTSNATTFIVDTADLASAGSVTGSTGNDTLVAGSTSIDLSSTTLTSIEILKAGTSLATTFTVDAADLASGGSVVGSTGVDTLSLKTTAFDLTSTTLTSIEKLVAGVTLATTFTVNQADLASGGTVTGTTQTDILTISGSSLDLSSTTLVSIENLKAGLSTATTFIVDQDDLVASGSVTGSSGNDTLTIKGNTLDLSSTTLSSVEIIRAGLSTATTFTVDAADLLSGGSVNGSSGTDTLVMKTSAFDLTSTTLTSVEVLQAGVSTATTFTIDLADLASGGTVIGSSGLDTLTIKNASYDLTSTTLSSVEILQAGLSLATTFTLDQADLANAGTVAGSTGTDTLLVAGASLDLTSTTLTSIEALRAGTGVATTFTVDAADLASGGSVIGSSGADTLIIKGTSYDLTSTTISNVEILQAGSSLATTFTVDTADLLAGGSVVGSSGADTLTILGTGFDLTSTTVSSVEILKTASSLATTFTVDQVDLLSGGSVVGSSGVDTLIVNNTTIDLSSTSLTSIEILQLGVAAPTNFIVDQADLASGGSVLGNGGNDTLSAFGTAIDLTGTTLSSIEILNAASSLATTFTVDQSDLVAGGSVTGNLGSDTLAIAGTSLDLTSTSLTSIEILRAGLSTATTFTVDQSDLLSNGAVIGSSGVDTLVTSGTALDLSSTALSSVEVLKAGTNLATTFTVDQVDLVAGGSVVGSSGADTLTVNGHNIDLSNTTLTSIETINTSAPGSSSTFSVGGGIGGATIELTTNSVTDTVSLATGYKVADTTSDATILAHSVTLSHFADGVGGDVIDLSAITNGSPTSSVDITGYIALSAPATLKEALDLAAAGNGSSTATVVTFQYAGDTYVLADNSASHTLTTDDVVVKLTGTHTLSDASNITF